MLIAGKKYRRNDESFVTIGGLTKHHPQYVWSIGGDWYDKDTGAFVSYYRDKVDKQYRHSSLPVNNWRSISNHTPIEDSVDM